MYVPPFTGRRWRMTCKGVIKGRTIELEEPLPFREGQAVTVSVQPSLEDAPPGSAAAICAALDAMGPVDPDIIDEFERAIEERKHPPQRKGAFDEE
jgi:hypothetical protein